MTINAQEPAFLFLLLHEGHQIITYCYDISMFPISIVRELLRYLPN
jgi:hypothetical protein